MAVETNRGTKKDEMKKRRLLTVLAIIFGIGLIGFIYLYFFMNPSIYQMRQDVFAAIENMEESTFQQNNTSIIYNSDGEILSKAKSEKDVLYLNYDQIPQQVMDAIVLIEDKRFYRHNGVDLISLAGIGIDFLTNGFEVSRGGSTITQQLARNIFLSHEVSLERKYKEIVTARQIEKMFTKKEILEFYLNNIYYGNGAYGIGSAALCYFDKNIDELTFNEQVFLLGIPSNPTLYNPYENMEKALYRRDVMLGILHDQGYIDEEQMAEMKAEEIIITPNKIEFQNYLQSYADHCAAEAIMKMNGFSFQNHFANNSDMEKYRKHYDEEYKVAMENLHRGGYRIYTSLDVDVQNQVQEILDKELAGFTDRDSNGIYKMQGSACIIDNNTGNVVSIVGGRSQNESYLSLNRGFQSYRQPGSTIKPLVAYGPILDDPQYGANSRIEDIYSSKGPKNYDDRYSGGVTMASAVAYSKNVPAWNVVRELGTENAIQYLYDLDFRRLVPQDDHNMAIALGGFTYGTNVVEMASGYSTFSRDGKFIQPTCIERIERSTGEILYTNESETKAVYSQRSSRLMTEMLVNVMKYGTGARVSLRDRSCAGKTGTTNDAKDGWFIGYTPQYTMAVWAGYDTPKSVGNLQGSTYPGRIWKQSMAYLHEGLPVMPFPRYTSLKERYQPQKNIGKPIKLPKKDKTVLPEDEEIMNQGQPEDYSSGQNEQEEENKSNAGKDQNKSNTGKNHGNQGQHNGQGNNQGTGTIVPPVDSNPPPFPVPSPPVEVKPEHPPEILPKPPGDNHHERESSANQEAIE